MKRFVFLVCIFFSHLFIFAQTTAKTSSNDSLWGVWTNTQLADTSRLFAFGKFIWDKYLFTAPDSALYYAVIMYDYAVEKNEMTYVAVALNHQGSCYYLKGDYKTALSFYTRACAIHEKLDNKKYLAGTYNSIGNIYKNQGDYPTALQYYEKSIQLEVLIGNRAGMATSLNNMGSVYLYQGDFPMALEYYSQSLALAEEVNNSKSIANACGNIGIVYKNLGDYATALEFYMRSLTIQEEIGDKKGMAISINNIGAIYKSLGEFDKTIEYFNQCLALQNELGNKQGATYTIQNLGIIYSVIGDTEKGLAFLLQANELQNQLGDKRGILNSLNIISANYISTGKFIQARVYATQALELSEKLRIPSESKSAYRTLYQIYNGLGMADSATFFLTRLRDALYEDLDKNYSILSERERELYFLTLEEDFSRYYDFAVRYADSVPELAVNAYNTALFTKGLSLKSSTLLRQSIFASGDSLLIRDFEIWREMKQQISKAYAKGQDTKEMQLKADELERSLVVKSADFGEFGRVKNLSWQDIKAQLKPDQAAVEFITYRTEVDSEGHVSTRYGAIIIRNDSQVPTMLSLCNERFILDQLGGVQTNNLQYITSVYGSQTEPSTGLYDHIWKPMEPYLEDISTVYFSPTGMLHKIAFAAIQTSGGDYLCDQYNLHQLSSTGVLALAQKEVFSEDERFMLYGGIDYSADSSDAQKIWQYLPGTLEEAELINSKLTKKGITAFYRTGLEADEKSFKENAHQASFIHIATHGFFYPDPDKIEKTFKADTIEKKELIFRGSGSNYALWNFVKNKNPLMRSGLILSRANGVWSRKVSDEGEDGILTAAEVATLNLQKVKLVVLSACETGLGDIKGSEGVYGLQRAFKMAGVKYMIMSLWQVPDQETAEFMVLFYKKLLKYKEVRRAFNETQQAMRTKYDPYYWAAFTLIE